MDNTPKFWDRQIASFFELLIISGKAVDAKIRERLVTTGLWEEMEQRGGAEKMIHEGGFDRPRPPLKPEAQEISLSPGDVSKLLRAAARTATRSDLLDEVSELLDEPVELLLTDDEAVQDGLAQRLAQIAHEKPRKWAEWSTCEDDEILVAIIADMTAGSMVLRDGRVSAA